MRLQNKKIAIYTIIISLLIVFIIIGYNSIKRNQPINKLNEYDIIPVDASIVLQIESFDYIKKLFFDKNNPLTSLLSINELNNLKKQIITIDSIANINKEFSRLIKTKNIVVSFHNIGNHKNSILITKKLTTKINQKQIVQYIQKMSEQVDTQSRKYINTNIYTFKVKGQSYYYSFFANFFALSTNVLSIENQIRHIENYKNIKHDPSFAQIKPLLNFANLQILINYKNFRSSVDHILSNRLLSKISLNNRFANWSVLDLNYNNRNIYLTGYSTVNPNNTDNYLSIFQNQKPRKFDDWNYIPDKTAEFCVFLISNLADFNTKYEKLLDSKNISLDYVNSIKEFNQQYKVNIINQFFQFFDNTIIFFKARFNEYASEYNYYCAIKHKSPKDIVSLLQKITNQYIEKNKITNKDIYQYQYKIDNSTTINFYKIPDQANFIAILFGQLYNVRENLNHYFVYDNYVYFADSYKSLENLYYSLYTNKTIEKNKEIVDFLNNSMAETNILFFSNNIFNTSEILKSLNKNYQQTYQKNYKTLSHFNLISFSIASEKDIFKTQITINYNPNVSQSGLTAWEKKIKSNLSHKPFVFINHNTNEKELLILDDSNYLYLLDKKSSILWSRKIKEKITSSFYQVDLYKNKKFQIMFSTENFILTFDRNGEPLNEKCLRLPKSSQYGITIVDYDNKKDYRILVPIENKVYLYNANDMKPIAEWKSPTSQTEIQSRVFYFNYENKDYLVFVNKSEIFITDRRGNIRIPITKTFQFPNNVQFYFQPKANNISPCFLTTDASGKIIIIDLKGNVKIVETNSFSVNHTFVAQDINGDKIAEAIYADDKTLFVYDISGRLIFSYTFKDIISFGPSVLKFPNNIYIGVTVANENKIYFFDKNGNIHSNFPLSANGPFGVTMLSPQQSFSLITSFNNTLLNYFVN